MRTDRKDDYCWTLMDPAGFIYDMPRALKRVLQSRDWSKMYTKEIINAQTQLTLYAENKQEVKIATFRFNFKGVLIESASFDETKSKVCNKILCSYGGELYHVAGGLSEDNENESSYISY